jgi:hypothetical protein
MVVSTICTQELMLNYTATDQHGRQVSGDVDGQTHTRRGVTVELYDLGYQRAAIYDGNVLVAGIDTDSNGHRYWWASLKPAALPSVREGAAARGPAAVGTHTV